jgi:hypothetical protein
VIVTNYSHSSRQPPAPSQCMVSNFRGSLLCYFLSFFLLLKKPAAAPNAFLPASAAASMALGLTLLRAARGSLFTYPASGRHRPGQIQHASARQPAAQAESNASMV